MKSQWIWYYGDFEMYHCIKLHLRRQEGNLFFPAFWKLYEPYVNVLFKKNVTFDTEHKMTVTANRVGYVLIHHKKYEFGKEITLPTGNYDIEIRVSNENGLPSVFIDGDINSDDSWLCDDYTGRFRKVGTSSMYDNKKITPEMFCFEYKELKPVSIKYINNGTLFDYGFETFAKIIIKGDKKCRADLGETEIEALSGESYIHIDYPCNDLISKAFRYIYVPEKKPEEINMCVMHEYLPEMDICHFDCDDPLIKSIWDISVHTFRLNSREFFLDGIKRDRWVWSGDAYQSYFINRYASFDEETAKRTIVCLGGKDEVYCHINTITDYTFYWILSIYDHYEMTGNIDFIREIFPRMRAYMNFVRTRLDENGFVIKKDNDWIFIDWADIDKDGTLCAEQFLLLRAMETYIKCAKLIGEGSDGFENAIPALKNNINKFFWNDKEGAFVDCYETGKNRVTRHANIFALLFDYADSSQKQKIIDNVLLSNTVAQIKTPYFKFFELESLCKIGKFDEVLKCIKDYWGSMVKAGATSFWEEFDPNKNPKNQLNMYGVKFDKSLCHAWGASPIYLIGRYFIGLSPTSPGYKTFEIKPIPNFPNYTADIPVKDGMIHIQKSNRIITICSSVDGGTLKTENNTYRLSADKPITAVL